MDPNMVITLEQVKSFIRSGDDIWDICKEDTEQDSMKLLNVAFYQCLDDTGIVLTSDTEIWPDLPDIFDESEDNTLDNIPCDVGDGLPDLLDYNEEINNYDDYLEPDDDNFMDCLENGDDVYNLQRCNVTDVKDDKTVHGCDINHDPKPMAKIGEETFQRCDYDNDIQILESWNEDQSNVGGNAAGKLAESVVAHENETKYGAVNESEQIQEQSDDGVSISSHDTVPIYARVLEEESNIYCDGYTVQLPKTEDGFMINLIGTNTGVPFMEEYYAAFGGYIKHKNRQRAIAEEMAVFRNEDDVLVTLDSSDLSGTPLSELVLQLTSAPIGTIIKLTMINKSDFNGRYYRAVKKGNG